MQEVVVGKLPSRLKHCRQNLTNPQAKESQILFQFLRVQIELVCSMLESVQCPSFVLGVQSRNTLLGLLMLLILSLVSYSKPKYFHQQIEPAMGAIMLTACFMPCLVRKNTHA
jgi:hypothetical protein